MSPRHDGPFVVVDCGAIPENLIEAELFGHAKGAFTGAVEARAGAIESAHGGTLFLDEVGELPLAMQPKLLRFLESRTVRRLGEREARAIDVRVVSATHRDLRTMVNRGAFREDLYFRLAVLPVAIPPLRDRPDDLPLLVQHFLPKGSSPLAPELLRELAKRPWEGNVRELRNFVERALALGADAALDLMGTERPLPREDALPRVSLEVPFKTLRERWLDHLEREYVKGLLERFDHNVSAVANAAGIDRTYVHRLMKKHGL
jgi:transcriptional regulator with PAS, ATPase and Fis domain